MQFQGQSLSWTAQPDAQLIGGYSIEYMGNGNFRSITDKCAAWDVIDWNINNVDASTGLVNVINVLYSQTSWPVVYNTIFECDRNSPNVIYMGADDGNNLSSSSWALTRNSSNQWSLHDIPSSFQNNHIDHRYCYIASSNFNVSNPGLNDIVLYGNDGGLTKVTMNNVSASNVTFANLNGNGLYISDLIDADAADEHAITVAAWHDGWYAYNKQTNVWTGEIVGDGMNATIDKRFTTGTGYTMIYTHALQNDYGFQRMPSPTNSIIYTPIPNPPGNQTTWIHRPMQFLNGIMYCTSYRAWSSPFMSYPATSADWVNQHGTAPSNYQMQLNTHLAKQFHVCKDNINYKYHLLSGEGAPWKLAQETPSNWYDRTQIQVAVGLLSGEKFPYTDFVVDDRDHDRIFVSMGSVPWNFDWGDNRVFYSPSGGAPGTFIDISTNLPPVPVNCMLYQQGTDDIIYAGTDVGVYWWRHDASNTTSYTGCWIKMDGGMPNCLISRLRIDLCEGKLIAATYGRGIWETPLVNMDPATLNADLAPIIDVINTNTTWNADYRPEGSVQITNGATLTIVGTPNQNDQTSTTTIYMPHYGAIYVEPGCRLIVDGAKITNGCNGWYGVIAHGTTGQNQVYNSTNDNYPFQGYVQLQNAIIENAEEAFRNYGPDGVTGGVIFTGGNSSQNEWTYFVNNRRSANFGSSTNHNSSNNIAKDESKFNNTKFLLTATAKQPFWSHVSMWEVRGILFGNCRFYNNHGTQLDRRMAIESGNSTYRIKGGIFKGFYRAIQSGDYFSNILFPISIEAADFDGNEVGVDFHAVNLPSLTNNTFKIGAKQSPSGWYFYSEGSRLYYTTNFRYCSNNHQKLNTPPASSGFPYTSGLEVFSSGSPNVNIKSNNYEGLYIGTDIDNSCGVTSPPSGINLVGNTNSGNTGFDFVFQDKPKIHPYQHNSATLNSWFDATQNTFSNNPAPIYHWYFNSGGNAPITYKYINSLANQTPTLWNSGVLNPISTDVSAISGCFAIDPVITNITETDLNASKQDYNTHEGIYNNLNSMYTQLIDNGSTEDELENLNGFGAANYMTLRAHLLNLSPYVSQEVLDSVAHLGILPNVYLFEILMANPDATQNDDFLRFLEEDMTDPFPHYMIAMIEDSWQGVTVRTALERNMIAEMDILSEYKNQILLSLESSRMVYYSRNDVLVK